jgi:exodeoxyribonuclease V alpha subunit
MATNPQTSPLRSAEPLDVQVREISCVLSASGPRFRSPNGEFAVWQARPLGRELEAEVILTGPLAHAGAGEQLLCQGRWRQHRRYGWRFEVSEYRSGLPQTAEGIAIWLAAKLPGVGRTFARAAVEHFGADNVFAVLDEDPTRIGEVQTSSGRGLSSEAVSRCAAAWRQASRIRQLESWLYSHGVPPGFAERLYRRYGEDVAEILRADPYRVSELRGVGFIRADQLARRLGVDGNDPRRIAAAIDYLLERGGEQGHSFLTQLQLEQAARRVLSIDDVAELRAQLRRLDQGGSIVVERHRDFVSVYQRESHERERRLAARVRSMLAPVEQPLFAPVERPPTTSLTPEQWQVIELVRTRKLALLVGGPGVGKSTAQAELVRAVRRAGKRIALCAPTGKAARRLAEVSGIEAQTIHRLLEFSPTQGSFLRSATNPLDCDVLVVDEASMLPLALADALFAALSPHTHVLLVGDPDQLPPVGSGRVLADLVACQELPRVRLDRVHRQQARSLIIQNARRINAGLEPLLSHDEARAAFGADVRCDVYYRPCKGPEAIAATVVDAATGFLPRSFALDPVSEVLVLSPQRKGPLGVDALNAQLARRLNPRGETVTSTLRIGDRIVQTRNDHSFELMNGELAVVKAHRGGEVLLSVDDGAREIWLPVEALSTWQPGYCCSVHRAQGSEMKAVVLPLSRSHWATISRSLLYTACTRASEVLVLVGERHALSMALEKTDAAARQSALRERILDPALSGVLF